MKLEIKSDTNNPLIGRREVKGTLVFDKATPSNADLKKELASKLDVKEDLIIPKHIYTQFGNTIAEFRVFVYESKQALERFEPKTKSMKQAEKKTAEEAKKKEEEAKEEAKAAEPKPEEKKEEEKK